MMSFLLWLLIYYFCTWACVSHECRSYYHCWYITFVHEHAWVMNVVLTIFLIYYFCTWACVSHECNSYYDYWYITFVHEHAWVIHLGITTIIDILLLQMSTCESLILFLLLILIIFFQNAHAGVRMGPNDAMRLLRMCVTMTVAWEAVPMCASLDNRLTHSILF